ncbi:hypothetical protein A11A3_04605 [Alcanivorax hongdengensis A-11-3]|uniref:Deacetylase n=1 Tax=Alcanivorax hongdengensis A-11-3 TaxID=1177179 RepID=L0WDV5_9GAMM|nr:hypothetical protein A11A3_04605 [Alcanivorax hongdengensis A-11-3]
MPALVSIHDVMPETRDAVQAMLDTLSLPAEQVILLVVPGRDWQRADLHWLQDLQRQGHPLAGHGWQHRCQPPATLYHRLHSRFLSRNVAEHLSFSAGGIARLIRDCHQWFVDQGLTPSALYVPPAWAMGAISKEALSGMPFRYFETLGGIYDAREDRFDALPLVGFEADTGWRALVLRLFNGWNLMRARRSGQPLRVGLHPHDFSLKLAGDILSLLAQVQPLSAGQQPVIAGNIVQSR